MHFQESSEDEWWGFGNGEDFIISEKRKQNGSIWVLKGQHWCNSGLQIFGDLKLDPKAHDHTWTINWKKILVCQHGLLGYKDSCGFWKKGTEGVWGLNAAVKQPSCWELRQPNKCIFFWVHIWIWSHLKTTSDNCQRTCTTPILDKTCRAGRMCTTLCSTWPSPIPSSPSSRCPWRPSGGSSLRWRWWS